MNLWDGSSVSRWAMTLRMKFSAGSVWENKCSPEYGIHRIIQTESGNRDMPNVEETYDIVVVGAGHAGCEAALAAARMGFSTIIFTVSVDSIALMPCNPNVGGSSKGHLVRELDALGGEMGKNIDKTFIQSKMLNMSKGPAVHSLRAQADKRAYSQAMRNTLENTPNLHIRQAEVSELIVENHELKGVKTFSGAVYHCRAAVLCTGTYLRARCIYGDCSNPTGPNGLQAATHLTASLNTNGIVTRRFKTGTPARIDGRTIDFSKMTPQPGDRVVTPFSFSTDPSSVQKEQVNCYLTYTNEETHRIIRENIDRSPLYSGVIKATGPRYCPSIEDKVMKFPDHNRHQVFIEPEGLYTHEMYIDGMSSSMPEDVQYAMYRTVPGLEHAKIVRNAYAIEYDCISANQLKLSLEFKAISGLFAGGQFNGSSGYEEAAAQGFIAGVNAARKLQGKEPVILDRSQAYIGVLIDDLVTKDNIEPYRMMTSRAEYRLLLRQDNADLRLCAIGHEIGLVSNEHYAMVEKEKEEIAEEIRRLSSIKVGANSRISDFLMRHGSRPLGTGESLAGLIRRPELSYESIAEIDPDRPKLSPAVIEQININIKYEGYIRREERQILQFRKMESRRLGPDIDYTKIGSLRIEAAQKLNQFKPESVGQASRIAGVSPADISVLLVYLEQSHYPFDRTDRKTEL
jgi:tRNA uridine 5-carboxymethylaminomethyl modification enzyme